MKTGSKHSPETIERIRLSKLGTVPSQETRDKISRANTGHKGWSTGLPVSEETRRKIGEANKGKRLGMRHTEETRAVIREKRALQGCSDETRSKMSAAKKGTKQSKGWIDAKVASRVAYYDEQGRKTPENIRIRMSKEYRDWRESVFKRDNWTCQICFIRSEAGNPVVIQADHIRQFAFFPELRFELSNGRTLCVPCHRATPTYARNSRTPRLPVEAFGIGAIPFFNQEDSK